MGYAQSILLYFYPNWYQQGDSEKLNATKIQLSLNKLAHNLRLMQRKLQVESQAKQKELIKMMMGPKKQRSKEVQRVFLKEQIFNSYKFEIYEELYLNCNRIKNEAHQIEADPSKISNECLQAVCCIIHFYKELSLYEIVDLKEFMPEPHPQISVSKLPKAAQDYANRKEPSHYHINLYVLEMLKRNQDVISLEQINEIGFDFEENPVEPVKETGSSAMFALEIEDLEFEGNNERAYEFGEMNKELQQIQQKQQENNQKKGELNFA